MNCIKIGDTLINLDNVARVTFVENDASTTSDDRCRVHFTGLDEALVFRGSSAKEVFARLEVQMLTK